MLLAVCTLLPVVAQQSSSPVVPNVTRYGGILTDLNGRLLTGITGVTFALYKDEQGGIPLWMEIQNVTPDKNGHYSVVLGSTAAHGLPSDLFTSGEARWLGVQPEGQNERPRVLLVSVPYAMKAADAETLGGLPVSAFVLAAPSTGQPATADLTTAATAAGQTSSAAPPPSSLNVTTTGGTANAIPLFTTASNIQNSILTQTSTTSINVAGRLILPPTGVATSTAGFISNPHDTQASSFNSSTNAAVTETFRWQAEPVGNNTATPSGKLNLLFASGISSPAETGLSVSGRGIITFAPGQTFPKVTGNETVTGNVSANELISTVANGTAPLQVTSTTQVANLNASMLGGLTASAFQPAGSYATLGTNFFGGSQVIAGGLSVSGPINGGLVMSGAGSNSVGLVGSFVGGGFGNMATGNSAGYTTISGGTQNKATFDFSVVSGGAFNTAAGTVGGSATVGGGYSNSASEDYSTVAGGFFNSVPAGAMASTVGGGQNNTASGATSVVAGGNFNTASGANSFVGGGTSNVASGSNSMVVGGSNSVASGFSSFAAGYQAQAVNDGAFVWADTQGPFASIRPNIFMVRATGGFFFSTSANSTVGAELPPGSGSWVSFSDRNVKEHFSAVDHQQLLRKLAAIPMETWNYKTQDASIRHIGPMAQDFRAAFNLGEDDKHISVVDGQGVALAGVQALYELSQAQSKQIAELTRRVEQQSRQLQTASQKINHLTRQYAHLAKTSTRRAAPRAALTPSAPDMFAPNQTK